MQPNRHHRQGSEDAQSTSCTQSKANQDSESVAGQVFHGRGKGLDYRQALVTVSCREQPISRGLMTVFPVLGAEAGELRIGFGGIAINIARVILAPD